MRTSLNAILSAFSIVASTLSTLILLPMIQGSMGLEAYGYIGVAASFINMSTIASVAITSMAARFISLPLNRKCYDEANKYFNSIGLACSALAVLFILLFILVAANVQYIMRISPAMVYQVRILILVLAGSLCCTVLKTPFIAALYSSNRLYIDYFFIGMSQIARVAVPWLLFPCLGASIWLPYAGAFVVDVCMVLFHLASFKRFTPQLSISHRFMHISYIRELLQTGMWVSIQKAGSSLLTTISLYLGNLYVGPFLSGVFNSITQLQSFMGVYINAVVNLYVPYLYRAYSNDEAAVRSSMGRGFEYVGIAAGSMFGGIAALAVPFLSFWTGTDMAPYAPCIGIMIFYPVITYASELFGQFFIAEKVVKIPGVSTIVFGFVNVGLTAVLCGGFKLGLIGLAAAQALSLVIRNYLVTVLYASRLLRSSYFEWVNKSSFSLKLGTISCIAGIVLQRLVPATTLIVMLAEGFLAVIVGVASGVLMLPKSERHLVLSRFGLVSKRKEA